MKNNKFTMENALDKLTRAQEVYDKKFDSVIKTLSTMEVTDENFNKLIDTCSSLISLNLQTLKIFEDQEHKDEQRKVIESMKKNEGENK